jgi:phosphopantetheine adenylyltransferase
MNSEDIIYYAEKYFAMIYVGTTEKNNEKILLFTIDNKSLIKNFLNYFKEYKVGKFYDAHNEDELYGIVIK